MECLEEGTNKVGALVEEGSRDLLARASTSVFSHLLCSDPDFDFEVMIAPVPEVISDTLAEWVEDDMGPSADLRSLEKPLARAAASHLLKPFLC